MAIFVSLSGGIRLFEIDTEQEPDTFTPQEYSPPASEPVHGILSLGVTVCGCISLFQFEPEIGFAIITENSSKSIVAPTYRPIITEDEQYYLVTEEAMAEPTKISELTPAVVNDIIANLSTAEIVISLDIGSGYASYKLDFNSLIDVLKTAINTGKLDIVMSGNGGTNSTLVGTSILDAELNEQNIAILAAIPMSGEQGLYVNTATGDYEVYNMGDDLTGSALKIIYSKG